MSIESIRRFGKSRMPTPREAKWLAIGYAAMSVVLLAMFILLAVMVLMA